MSLFQRIAKVQQTAKPQRVTPTTNERRLMEGLEGGRVKQNAFGNYYLIERHFTEDFNWPVTLTGEVESDLKLIHGIGPATEALLKAQGFNNIASLVHHARWGAEAQKIIQLVEERKLRMLGRLGMQDQHLLRFFQPAEVVCLDIESTGLWASQPLFLVGILFRGPEGLVVQQYLARHIGEEKALLADLIKELAQFKLLITYNGKRFDIPYIEGRTVEHKIFYRFQHGHIDLLHHARRHYKHKLPNCRLITLEEYLLNQVREGDVPGALIPAIYHRFAKTQDSALIKDILDHNVLDLISLAKFLPLIQENNFSYFA